MGTTKELYGTFTVTTSSLCFGGLHNIWGGFQAPVQTFRKIESQPMGTVKAHKLEYNVPAQNGTWNTFQLVDVNSKRVAGWFVSHADVDPAQEIDKTLRVSGSPYDFDSGSSMNDESTYAEGIFVINRYDWGYYDRRYQSEIGEGIEEGDSDILANSNSCGLVDRAYAERQVREWTDRRPSERGLSEAGIWMYIPHGEYMFGRFGFNDARNAARSFLFFSSGTVFTSTTFAGLDTPFRREESHEERFERRLREGFDFTGIETLEKMAILQVDPAIPKTPTTHPSTPASGWIGPFGREQHIFRAQDLEALRLHKGPMNEQLKQSLLRHNIDPVTWQNNQKTAPFVEPWKEAVYDLVNEVILTYLVQTIIPRLSSETLSLAAESLFPDHENSRKLDYSVYPFFTHPDKDPIRNFEAEYARDQIKLFLSTHIRDPHIDLDSDFLAGICRVVTYIMTEILELSSNCSIDNYHFGIVPVDVRITLCSDKRIFEMVKDSKILWERMS